MLGFCFSGTSLLGKHGQICFVEFLKIMSCFLAQNFCTDRVDILLCSEANRKGGFSMKFGTFGPSKLVESATSAPTTPTTPSVNLYYVVTNNYNIWTTYILWLEYMFAIYTNFTSDIDLQMQTVFCSWQLLAILSLSEMDMRPTIQNMITCMHFYDYCLLLNTYN